MVMIIIWIVKEIIANEVQDTPPLDEQIQEELKETKPVSSEASKLLVSPEFKPLYEMCMDLIGLWMNSPSMWRRSSRNNILCCFIE